MAVRPVRIWPDPILSEVAKPVAAVDAYVRALIADLFDTMYAENGIGLAANQVGVASRILVLDLDPKKQAESDPEVAEELASWNWQGPVALVNPKIVEAHGEIVWEEGCLSVPGVTDNIKRKERVIVEALDRQGEPMRIEASGLFAVAIQHELDHLNGKVFVDYLSRLKRDVIKKKMVNLKTQGETEAPPRAAAAAR